MYEDSIDYLKLYFGDEYKINDFITIREPTLGDIRKIGEQKYYSMIYTLCAIPSDMKSQLYDMNIDYEEISDFEFFMLLTRSLTKEETYPLLGELDLSTFNIAKNEENGDLVLLKEIELPVKVEKNKNSIKCFFSSIIEKILRKNNTNKEKNTEFEKKQIIIDKHIYQLMVSYIREMHGIVPKIEHAANEDTKKVLIEFERQKILQNKNKPYKSSLLPLISSMCNSSGFKYKPSELQEIPIYQFMDSVQRIQIIKSADALLKGCYGGMIDASKINKRDLNWMRELVK